MEISKLAKLLKMNTNSSEEQVWAKFHEISAKTTKHELVLDAKFDSTLDEGLKWLAKNKPSKLNEMAKSSPKIAQRVSALNLINSSFEDTIEWYLENNPSALERMIKEDPERFERLNNTSSDASSDKNLEWFMENNPSALERMPEEDPERFKRLNEQYFKKNY